LSESPVPPTMFSKNDSTLCISHTTPDVKKQSKMRASHHKLVPIKSKLKGVNAMFLTRNQSIRLKTHPRFAGKHIMQVNIEPKCSEILLVMLLMCSNILNGPLPNTIIFENPYTAMQYKKTINQLLIVIN